VRLILPVFQTEKILKQTKLSSLENWRQQFMLSIFTECPILQKIMQVNICHEWNLFLHYNKVSCLDRYRRTRV
jgi:hypothetical protein